MNYGRINENGQVEYYKSYHGLLNVGDRLVFNPTEEEYNQMGWYPIEYIDAIGTPEIKDGKLCVYTKTPITLEKAIARKVVELNRYDNSNAINEFFLSDTSMWVTLNERINMKQSLDVLEDDEQWTYWYNLVPFTFPVYVFKNMLKAVERYAIMCKNRTFEHERNIRALESVEDVENYDFTTGYPEKVRL